MTWVSWVFLLAFLAFLNVWQKATGISTSAIRKFLGTADENADIEVIAPHISSLSDPLPTGQVTNAVGAQVGFLNESIDLTGQLPLVFYGAQHLRMAVKWHLVGDLVNCVAQS